MFKRLRTAWVALFAAPAMPKSAPKSAPEIDWGRVGALLEDLSRPEPRRLYTLPQRLPGVFPAKFMPEESTPNDGGVVLAMDSGYQEVLALDAMPEPEAWGALNAGGGIGPGVAFLGFPYLAELEQITEYRTPAESLAFEMTRRWFKLKNKGKQSLDKKMSEIMSRMEQLKLRDCFRIASYKTEWFGRCHVAINIKGQDDDRTRQLPLVISEIKKGSLLGFTPIEPYWMTPYSWNSTHPSRPDFYKPQSWFELGKKTHASRYLSFIFREVPDLLKPAYDFSGISMTQLMMPYVNRWLRTAKSVNDLINIFSIVTLSTDLQALIENPQKFMARLKGFTMMRDNKGLMAINKGTEELAVNDVSLGSLDKLQAQAQEHMSTPSRTPLIKFFGVTPTGLNATAEPELNVHAEYVHSMQMAGLDAHVRTALAIIQMDLYGTVDLDIEPEWLPLREMTAKEQADMRKSDSDRDAQLIQNNVVSPDEVRNKLQMDPDSGYNGLEGDAPEPQSFATPPDKDEENEEDIDTEKD